MNYFIDRLREPSTWRGLIFLVTGLGIHLSPEAMNYIIAAGTASAGLVGAITKDDK